MREQLTKCHDVFSWHGDDLSKEVNHTIIQALWRIDDELVRPLLAHSGKQTPNGRRFFLEPQKWRGTSPPPYKCDYKSHRKKADET